MCAAMCDLFVIAKLLVQSVNGSYGTDRTYCVTLFARVI